MKKEIYDDKTYQAEYLPWATKLLKSNPSVELINQAQADRDSIMNSTVFFHPPLNRIVTEELTLPTISNLVFIKQTSETGEHTVIPQENVIEDEDKVKLIADFEQAQLNSLTIYSLKNYLVVLNTRSSRWPIQYREGSSKDKDLLVTSEHLRKRTENLVIRTSKALLKHVVHRVAVGNIPEEFQDWSIDEADLDQRTINALRSAGIETYGDLGILSRNQLHKIPGMGEVRIEDIKADLYRQGWLSPAFK